MIIVGLYWIGICVAHLRLLWAYFSVGYILAYEWILYCCDLFLFKYHQQRWLNNPFFWNLTSVLSYYSLLIGDNRQRDITWVNVGPDLCHHVALPGYSELNNDNGLHISIYEHASTDQTAVTWAPSLTRFFTDIGHFSMILCTRNILWTFLVSTQTDFIIICFTRTNLTLMFMGLFGPRYKSLWS